MMLGAAENVSGNIERTTSWLLTRRINGAELKYEPGRGDALHSARGDSESSICLRRPEGRRIFTHRGQMAQINGYESRLKARSA